MTFQNNSSTEKVRYSSIYINADDNGKVSVDANTNGDRQIDGKNPSRIRTSPRIFFSYRSAYDSGPSAWSPDDMSCCTISLFILLVVGLTFVIVLWVVALLADGLEEEVDNCVIIWPIAGGVSAIFVLFLFLNGYESCLRRKKIREQAGSLGAKDSQGIYWQYRRTDTCSGEWYVDYERSRCIWISYLFLTFALLCVMTASVEQYFSLDSRCYSNLKHNLDNLLIGYEFLAYMSVAVLSLLACISCLLFLVFLVYLKEIALDKGVGSKAIKF